jgi:SAM-dependent methyltransferase
VLAGKLAAYFEQVTGIDRNADMTAEAGARLRGLPRVSIERSDFADFSPTGGADLITMVAALHHLDLDDTLTRIPALLAPGGRLLVVGLARPDTLTDLAFDVVSGAANPVMGMIKHPRAVRARQRAGDGQPVLPPIMDPVTTLAEIREAGRAHLPGAKVRRRMFFRYTLRWEKPAA